MLTGDWTLFCHISYETPNKLRMKGLAVVTDISRAQHVKGVFNVTKSFGSVSSGNLNIASCSALSVTFSIVSR